MNLFDDYLRRVEVLLPNATRAETILELAQDLEDELATLRQERPVTSDEELRAEILVRRQSPERLALSFRARYSLIGPKTFTAWRIVFICTLAIAIIVPLGVELASDTWSFVAILNSALITGCVVFTTVTIVFALMERYFDEQSELIVLRGLQDYFLSRHNPSSLGLAFGVAWPVLLVTTIWYYPKAFGFVVSDSGNNLHLLSVLSDSFTGYSIELLSAWAILQALGTWQSSTQARRLKWLTLIVRAAAITCALSVLTISPMFHLDRAELESIVGLSEMVRIESILSGMLLALRALLFIALAFQALGLIRDVLKKTKRSPGFA